MADTPTTTTDQPATGEPPTQVDDKNADPLGDPGKKALDEERRARRDAEKSAKDLATKLKEYEDRDKSETERLAEAKLAAEQAVTEAKAEALRLRIAARHGISDDDADLYLTGSDEATITRQAERLAELAKSTTSTPKPDLTQGGKQAPALNSSALEQDLRRSLGIS